MNIQQLLNEEGFAIIPNIYSDLEISKIIGEIEAHLGFSEHKTFATRQIVKQTPSLNEILWNDRMKNMFSQIANSSYFLTKSIYFDKPEGANWFVAYHQDISITASNRKEMEGFTKWTQKHGQIGVVPPKEILENTVTLRVHLDDTTAENGALKVLNASHLQGIRRFEKSLERDYEETICNVPKGGVMLMKPLLFHASARAHDGTRRRVLHLEFCNQSIPEEIGWGEKMRLYYGTSS